PPGPVASTTPAASWPRTTGTGIGRAPSTTDRSEWHTPQSVTRTSTSPARGSSRSTSPTARSPTASNTAARIADMGRDATGHRRGAGPAPRRSPGRRSDDRVPVLEPRPVRGEAGLATGGGRHPPWPGVRGPRGEPLASSAMGSFLLAWREARRAKGRFGLLTGAVTVLVFLVVFQQAVLDGLGTEFVGAIRNQPADVLVYGEDARLNLQGSVVPPAAPEEVAAVEGVARAEPLGVAAVTVEAGGELEDATLFGHVLDGPGAPVEIEEGRRPERDGEA